LNYRSFGKLNWDVSALGFGTMRLPTIGADSTCIDEPEAIKMIRYAIDRGVNYVDTAYVYHGGNSEILVGRALQDGYREKVKLATKMPTWSVKSQQDMNKYFDEQLKRLQTSHIDFYLLHGLDGNMWKKLVDLNVFSWMEKKLREGRISHSGFSFHDKLDVFKKIVDSWNLWDFCQILYNYVDADFQAGTKGLKYAASKGLAVVVMEPIAGGRLAGPAPTEVNVLLDSFKTKRTLVEWALKWVWNQPEVSVALSGMSTMEHVVENVEVAGRSVSNDLTNEELALIDQVKKKYMEIGFNSCTECRYCMPCPEGVNIPKIMALYNEYYVMKRDSKVSKKYLKTVPSESRAKKCVKCGRCELLCPQKLHIRQYLSEAALLFE
jgi:predicted aldo/keto reductase-like oxidoreductase